MSVFLESFLGSFMGLAVGGGMLMLVGALTMRYFVRKIMNEIWQAAAERVTSSFKGKNKKGDKKKRHIEPLMDK